MTKLDEKDCKILDLLQEDCRMPLTKIAKKVSLSVDSVKKRMKKMRDNDVYYQRIQLRPRNFGFANIVDIKIKLQYENERELSDFISYLKRHPRVAEILTIAGEYDFSLVVIAKDAIDLDNITMRIRNKFGRMIIAWNVSLTIRCYKFEEYKMLELFEEGLD